MALKRDENRPAAAAIHSRFGSVSHVFRYNMHTCQKILTLSCMNLPNEAIGFDRAKDHFQIQFVLKIHSNQTKWDIHNVLQQIWYYTLQKNVLYLEWYILNFVLLDGVEKKTHCVIW